MVLNDDKGTLICCQAAFGVRLTVLDQSSLSAPSVVPSTQWILTVIGCAFWAYGYFVRTSQALIDWPAFAPTWIADYLPNWPSEVGLMLTVAGSVAIYYAEIQSYRQTK